MHDIAFRADYLAAQAKKDHFYDVDACDHLTAFVSDCDKKIEQSKKTLAETQDALSEEVTDKANSVHELAENIGKKLAAAEQLGADGNVEESIKLMEEVENLRKRKVEAEQEYRNSMPASTYQQQKLRVCEVTILFPVSQIILILYLAIRSAPPTWASTTTTGGWRITSGASYTSDS